MNLTGPLKYLLAAGVLLPIAFQTASAEEDPLLTFDTEVIRSTVKLQSGNCVGSGFILLHRWKADTNLSRIVLVTAAHVLAEMPSTNVSLFLRKADKGVYTKLPHDIRIRSNGTNLWTQHPSADVAVMQIGVPSIADIGRLSTGLLAEDEFVDRVRIHPGDEVRVLGFPYGYEASNVGFPVLRSGRIASYPLTPATNYPTFMIDFRVFPGNSGGPVYISERRVFEKGSLDSVNVTALMGLVSKEAKISETIHSLNEHSIKTYELGLGIIVPAKFIIETIGMLP